MEQVIEPGTKRIPICTIRLFITHERCYAIKLTKKRYIIVVIRKSCKVITVCADVIEFPFLIINFWCTLFKILFLSQVDNCNGKKNNLQSLKNHEVYLWAKH